MMNNHKYYLPVIIISIFGQKSWIFLIGHHETNPHNYIHYNKCVMCLGQGLPSDWNTSQKIHRVCPQKYTSYEEK